MDTPGFDDFDDFLDDIEPMDEGEKMELLLRYASAGVDHLDRAGLVALCDYLRRTLPHDEHRTTLLEMIERKIALRDIGKS